MAVSLSCYLQSAGNRYISVIGQATSLIDKYYLQDVDRRDLFESAMSGMLEGLDPYSAYLGPELLQEMETALDQEFGGVGIEVQKPEAEGPLVVHSAIANTPAFRAGLRKGDQIWAIDGVDATKLALSESVRLMRGPAGSAVRVLLQRGNRSAKEELSLNREVVVLDSVLGDVRLPDGTWDYRLAENQRIGYLRITTFGKRTGDELRRILNAPTSASYPFDALIIDLRGNSGGLLDSAVEVCDLFIDEGVIVSTSGRAGRVRSSYAASPKSTIVPASIPIAVLVNMLSASASEIVAACLQDHRRAVVVGARTWGKGTVQNIFDLEGGRSALRLTTAGYVRPNGKNIHKLKDAGDAEEWGVLPDTGWEVAVSDEQLTKLLALRSQRDAVPLVFPGRDELAATGAVESPEEQPLDDPQLRRAVEYLEAKLDKADAPPVNKPTASIARQ